MIVVMQQYFSSLSLPSNIELIVDHGGHGHIRIYRKKKKIDEATIDKADDNAPKRPSRRGSASVRPRQPNKKAGGRPAEAGQTKVCKEPPKAPKRRGSFVPDPTKAVKSMSSPKFPSRRPSVLSSDEDKSKQKKDSNKNSNSSEGAVMDTATAARLVMEEIGECLSDSESETGSKPGLKTSLPQFKQSLEGKSEEEIQTIVGIAQAMAATLEDDNDETATKEKNNKNITPSATVQRRRAAFTKQSSKRALTEFLQSEVTEKGGESSSEAYKDMCKVLHESMKSKLDQAWRSPELPYRRPSVLATKDNNDMAIAARLAAEELGDISDYDDDEQDNIYGQGGTGGGGSGGDANLFAIDETEEDLGEEEDDDIVSTASSKRSNPFDENKSVCSKPVSRPQRRLSHARFHKTAQYFEAGEGLAMKKALAALDAELDQEEDGGDDDKKEPDNEELWTKPKGMKSLLRSSRPSAPVH